MPEPRNDDGGLRQVEDVDARKGRRVGGAHRAVAARARGDRRGRVGSSRSGRVARGRAGRRRTRGRPPVRRPAPPPHAQRRPDAEDERVERKRRDDDGRHAHPGGAAPKGKGRDERKGRQAQHVDPLDALPPDGVLVVAAAAMPAALTAACPAITDATMIFSDSVRSSSDISAPMLARASSA